MGLGKTFIGSEKLIDLDLGLGHQKDLIICQKSKINDWINHFCQYYRSDISAYDLTKKKLWNGFFENPNSYRRQVGIINYELAWRRPELLKMKDFTLMLDESSLIQR